MPLIILCGLPSSGKTRRVGELIAYLTQVRVEVVVWGGGRHSVGFALDPHRILNKFALDSLDIQPAFAMDST